LFCWFYTWQKKTWCDLYTNDSWTVFHETVRPCECLYRPWAQLRELHKDFTICVQYCHSYGQSHAHNVYQSFVCLLSSIATEADRRGGCDDVISDPLYNFKLKKG
jgi:hypothetical protein